MIKGGKWEVVYIFCVYSFILTFRFHLIDFTQCNALSVHPCCYREVVDIVRDRKCMQSGGLQSAI